MIPQCFSDVKESAAFLINLDRCPERLALVSQRIAGAGFSNLTRWRAVDGKTDDLAREWSKHGSPHLEKRFAVAKGCQGCTLSHLNLWRHVLDLNLPFATVFEDDVLFHSGFATLAPQYYDRTPKDFDLLYLGAQFQPPTPAHVQRLPCFCTHAYVITREGIELLLQLFKQCGELRTIDCTILNHAMLNPKSRLKWYCWNGTIYPVPERKGPNANRTERNAGLVFQDADLGSTV